MVWPFQFRQFRLEDGGLYIVRLNDWLPVVHIVTLVKLRRSSHSQILPLVV